MATKKLMATKGSVGTDRGVSQRVSRRLLGCPQVSGGPARPPGAIWKPET